MELLTRKEAAAELGISVNTLDKLREGVRLASIRPVMVDGSVFLGRISKNI